MINVSILMCKDTIFQEGFMLDISNFFVSFRNIYDYCFMCTVSFIPLSNTEFIFTSNRDESPLRKTISPQFYEENKTKLLYPKDQQAGGTWIGVSEHKRLICLLNGGFVSHKRKETYRMSRGVIVRQFLAEKNAIQAIKNYNFKGIEPFTIILVDWLQNLKLYEIVWDGKDLFVESKPMKPIIWSSSLLYNSTIKKRREKWFSNFLKSTSTFSEESTLSFHKTAGENNKNTNLVMDKGFVKTKSITQISVFQENCTMRYEDLETNVTNSLIF